jgi:hypothetical protein
MRLRNSIVGAACALLSASIGYSAIPEAELVLEVAAPPAPGFVPEASPPRFILMKNGQVFVGGSAQIAEGRLEGDDRQRLRKQIDRVRKLRGLRSEVTLGPGDTRYMLRIQKGESIVARGDPASLSSPLALQPLARLIESLLQFDHPSLRLIRPTEYLLAVRAGTMRGGCRSWSLALPLVEALSSPRVVPAKAASGWPTGAAPAFVCQRDKTYIVTFRPLLPGEKP